MDRKAVLAWTIDKVFSRSKLRARQKRRRYQSSWRGERAFWESSVDFRVERVCCWGGERFPMWPGGIVVIFFYRSFCNLVVARNIFGSYNDTLI